MDHLIFDRGVVQIPQKISSICFWLKKISCRVLKKEKKIEHFFVHWIKMKLFITLKERCKLKNALRVKVVFNSLKGEFWVAGDGQVIKLQNLCFKFPLKIISCKDREIKTKKSCRAGAIKKISSSLKILQSPPSKIKWSTPKRALPSLKPRGAGYESFFMG